MFSISKLKTKLFSHVKRSIEKDATDKTQDKHEFNNTHAYISDCK